MLDFDDFFGGLRAVPPGTLALSPALCYRSARGWRRHAALVSRTARTDLRVNADPLVPARFVGVPTLDMLLARSSSPGCSMSRTQPSRVGACEGR